MQSRIPLSSSLSGDVVSHTCKYVNYPISKRFAALNETGVGLMIPDRNNINRVTDVGVWAKQLFHSRCQSMSVSRCICSKTNMPLICCHQEAEYERALWDLIPSHSERDVPHVFLSSVMLHRPLLLFYNIDRIDYCRRYCTFECRMQVRYRPLIVGWRNIEISAFYPAFRPEHYIKAPLWGRAFDVHRLYVCGNSCRVELFLLHTQWLWQSAANLAYFHVAACRLYL